MRGLRQNLKLFTAGFFRENCGQQQRFVTNTAWGEISLGPTRTPNPWEKLKIGVVGAPLKLGQAGEQRNKYYIFNQIFIIFDF